MADDDIAGIQRLIRANQDGDAEYILEVLQSQFSSPDERMIAAKYLGDLECHEAVLPLISALRSGSRAVRVSAIKSLRKLRAVEAVDPLTEIATDISEHPVPRSWAITSLGDIGAQRSVPVLISLLDDDHPHNRTLAAMTLGRMGDASALKPLEAARRREGWRRRGSFRKAIRTIRRRKT